MLRVLSKASASIKFLLASIGRIPQDNVQLKQFPSCYKGQYNYSTMSTAPSSAYKVPLITPMKVFIVSCHTAIARSYRKSCSDDTISS